MSLNLKKLVVSSCGCGEFGGFFAESAEARRARFSGGPPNIKQDDQFLEASFDIQTDESFDDAAENFSLRNLTTGETLFTSAIGSVEPQLLETENQLEDFLNNLGLVDSILGLNRDDVFARIPNGEEPIASYVVDLTNDLNSNEQGKLILFYDNEFASRPQPNGWETNLT